MMKVEDASNTIFGFIVTTLTFLGTIAQLVFIIIGFFVMPHWWYPFALVGISSLVYMFPILDIIWNIIGFVAIPVCGVLMYLDLFNVI